MKSFNENKHFIVMMTVFALGVVITTTANAGNDRVSGRTLGMARTYTASSRGLDALGLNPANLALDDRGSTVTFEIAPFGVRAGSDLINYQIYQDYFTGVDSLGADGQPTGTRVAKKLTDSDKDAILGLFPGGIAHTQFNFDITEFGLSIQSPTIGGIGFSVSERIGVNFDIPEGYIKMLLDAFPENGAYYSLDNTAVTASWLREYNLSYARVLPFELKWAKNIAVGFGVKYIQGFGYFGTDHYLGHIQVAVSKQGDVYTGAPISGGFDFLQYQSSIPTSTDSISHYLMKPAGTGLGFDFGFSAELFQAFRVGASITDIGKVTWDMNPKSIVGNGKFEVSDINQQDSVKNAFKGERHDTTSFSTSLPTAVHIGASLQVDKAAFVSSFPGKLLLAADIHFGFNEEPGNTTTPRFSLGAEYRPVNALPIRTGISVGGRERFQWSLGLGINTPVWDLDFGTESIALLTNPNSFRSASFTLGMRFRI